jgi:hypothetical protein
MAQTRTMTAAPAPRRPYFCERCLGSNSTGCLIGRSEGRLRAASIFAARMKAGQAGIDSSDFEEGHSLTGKLAEQVPDDLIGRRLSAKEIAALTKKLE